MDLYSGRAIIKASVLFARSRSSISRCISSTVFIGTAERHWLPAESQVAIFFHPATDNTTEGSEHERIVAFTACRSCQESFPASSPSDPLRGGCKNAGARRFAPFEIPRNRGVSRKTTETLDFFHLGRPRRPLARCIAVLRLPRLSADALIRGCPSTVPDECTNHRKTRNTNTFPD